MKQLLRFLLTVLLVLSGAGARAQSAQGNESPSLSLVFASPEGRLAELPGAVTLIFSQPMQALAGTVATPAPVASIRRVSDQSEAAGHWVWYGAETAVFYWERPPQGATEYEVTVPASTRSLNGMQLGGPISFRFATPPPALLSASVDESHLIETHRYRVACAFNQPISPDEVRRTVSIVGHRSDATYRIPFQIADSDPASRTDFSLDLDRSANRVDQARLVVADDLRSIEGPITSGIAAEFPLPELVTLKAQIDCKRNQRGDCLDDEEGIFLTLSKSVKSLDLFRAARFNPRISKEHYEYEGDTTELDLRSIFDLWGKFGGHYQVDFPRGLTALDGERIGPIRLGFDVAVSKYALDLSPADGAITIGRQKLFVQHPSHTGVEIIGKHLGQAEFFHWIAQKDRSYQEVANGADLFREIVQPAGKKIEILSHSIPNQIWRGFSSGATLVAARSLDSQLESTRVLLSTDLGLVTHLSPWGAEVWVNRFSDATPVSGARVRLLANNGANARFVGTADNLGRVTIPPLAFGPPTTGGGGERSLLISAETNDDYTYDELPTWRELSIRPFVSLFTDRSLYRPGEQVHVKAFYRIPSPQGFVTPRGGRAEVRLFSPIGQLLAQTPTTLDDYGSVYVAMQLPRDISLGHARVTIRRLPALGEEPDDEQWFRVAQYRTLDIEAQGRLDRGLYLRGDSAKFSLSAKTLHDTPLCNAQVSWLARLEPGSYPYPEFDFTDVDSDSAIDLKREQLVLDESGRGLRQIAIAPQQMHGPMQLRVEATVAEKDGQVAIVADASAPVYPAAFAVGVSLGQDTSKYFVGDTVTLHPVALDTTGKTVVRPLAIAWYQIGLDPNQPKAIQRNELTKLRPLLRCETSSSAEPIASVAAQVPPSCALRPKRAGHYLARVVGQDNQGRQTAAAIEFYVWPKETRTWKVAPKPIEEAPTTESSPAELPTDPRGFERQCEQVVPGELDILLRQGPQREVRADTVMDYCLVTPTMGHASITLEGRGLVQHRVVALKPGGNYVAQQLHRAAYPYARVRFHAVFPAVRGKPGSDDREFEYELTDPTRKLSISLDSAPPYRPHSDKVFELRVTRQDRPTAAQVTLWAVDEGVARQSYYRIPDPFEELRGRYDVAVETFDNRRRIYVPSLGSHRTRAPKIRAGATHVSDPNFFFREDFPAVAWFLPNVMLDGSGRAKLKLRLPDSATTWHIYAVAAGSEASFGSYEGTITATEDLVIRPKLPRFARLGDRYEARFTIDHPKHLGQSARVVLAVTGAAQGGLQQQVTLGEAGSTQVVLPVETNSIGKATWTASVDAGQSRDAVKLGHAVTATSIEDAVAFTGSTKDRLTLPIKLPKDIDPDRGGLELVLGDSLAPSFLSAQQWLEQYPHRCTEQLASRLLSQIVTFDGKPWTPQLRERLRLLLLDVLARQRDDGGFGYYPLSSHSDPQLSAFVLMALSIAQAADVEVPNPVILSLAEYLDNHAAKTSPSEQALLEDALAMAGHARPWEFERLMKHPEHMNPFALGVLAHAATYVDSRLSHRLLDMLLAQTATSGKTMVVVAARERGSLFDSPVRNTASALRAIAAVDARSPLADRLTNGLLSLRNGPTWATTQDNVWAWMAFSEIHKHSPQIPRLNGKVGFGNAGLWQSDGSAINLVTLFVPMKRLLSVREPGLEFVASEGELHYQGTLRFARLHADQQAAHRGFSVERILRVPESSAAVQGGTVSFLLGSYVVMDVLVHVPVAREQVVIEAPLPAGLEAVDETLALTPHLTLPSIGTRRNPVHRELRDDRVLFYEEHLGTGSHVFSQLLLATTRGTFQTPAARAEAMYTPDVRGSSAPTVVEVR